MAYKILGISSGRPMGNAEVMLREALMECEKYGETEVRITRLRTLKIDQCDGCLQCMKDASEGGCGLCHKKDDMEWLKEQILWADAIIFSDPCFLYNPTAEVITMMNRAMGNGKEYTAACRNQKKYLGLICVGGSDTVDFSLPMQFYAMERMCKGIELVDQFYANWIRGKGFISQQPRHLERAKLLAKRVMNKLDGRPVPNIEVTIEKLNPMEHKDNIFLELEGCPVCHSAVVHMENEVFKLGQFTCSICGAKGSVQERGGKLTYVWDDDSVAHNRLHKDHDEQYIKDYAEAHKEIEGEKEDVAEFPVLTPDKDVVIEKPRITAFVAGPAGGTSEILARKALEEATKSGEFDGAIVRITDLNLHFCTGCLLCKVNARYRGGVDECVLKDDDLWLVDRIIESRGVIYSLDGVNGFTYGNIIALEQRFGHRTKSKRPGDFQRVSGTMVSAFDDQTKNATFAISQLWRQFANYGPQVAQEFFNHVPLTGDGILKKHDVLKKAAEVGRKVARGCSLILQAPENAKIISNHNAMCPSCGLSMIELRKDKTVACSMCDAQGRFEHRFGENNIIWDEYDVKHSRATAFGATLHFKHINFSQSDDRDVLDDPKLLDNELKAYKEYGKLVRPER